MSYHKFKDIDGEEHGSFEVWEQPVKGDLVEDEDGAPFPPGWYWWPCFPGCLPDSADPMGPFKSEAEAIEDARGDW